MLKKYIFSINSLKQGNPINFHMGSIMQGLLMENLPVDVVDRLHNQGLRPYSQYVIGHDQEGEWHLHALTDEMVQLFDKVWEQWDGIELKSHQKGCSYFVSHKFVSQSLGYKDLCKKYFLAPQVDRFIDINIKTPISFKSHGIYLNWPDLQLLVKNLCKRWNSFSDDMRFEDQEIIEFLQDSIALGYYRLYSSRFDLEGTYIPSAQGQFTVRLTGNDMSKRWLCLLLDFATYAGMGVKTAMGMGGIDAKGHNGNKK